MIQSAATIATIAGLLASGISMVLCLAIASRCGWSKVGAIAWGVLFGAVALAVYAMRYRAHRPYLQARARGEIDAEVSSGPLLFSGGVARVLAVAVIIALTASAAASTIEIMNEEQVMDAVTEYVAEEGMDTGTPPTAAESSLSDDERSQFVNACISGARTTAGPDVSDELLEDACNRTANCVARTASRADMELYEIDDAVTKRVDDAMYECMIAALAEMR